MCVMVKSIAGCLGKWAFPIALLVLGLSVPPRSFLPRNVRATAAKLLHRNFAKINWIISE